MSGFKRVAIFYKELVSRTNGHAGVDIAVIVAALAADSGSLTTQGLDK